jgi:NitT/TauT family transport system permease protein
VLERLVMPLFVGLQSVPKIAIAPLILIWVGAGTGSKVLVVMSIAFFPIVINTLAGFKEVDDGAIEVFRMVAATERQQLFLLRLPFAVPYIFAGLRIATTLAVMGAIVAEWLAASDGLGYLVLSGSFNFNAARSFSAIAMLSIIMAAAIPITIVMAVQGNLIGLVVTWVGIVLVAGIALGSRDK